MKRDDPETGVAMESNGCVTGKNAAWPGVVAIAMGHRRGQKRS